MIRIYFRISTRSPSQNNHLLFIYWLLFKQYKECSVGPIDLFFKTFKINQKFSPLKKSSRRKDQARYRQYSLPIPAAVEILEDRTMAH
jgi:hypothetical protein